MKKTQRIHIILEILEHWGRLNKSAIDHHLGTKTGLELTSALKRAIYRDLEELVNHNRINIEYFHRDKTPIEDYAPEIHKNVISEWSLIGSENKILGQDYLNKINSQIYVPKLFKNDVSITKGESAPKENHVSIYFVISGSFLALNIHQDSLPIKLHICRNTKIIDKKLIEELEKNFGLRSATLMVPNSMVSSFELNSSKQGHLLLSINSENLNAKDLNSSNGSKFSTLSEAIAKQIVRDGALLGNQTIKNNWAETADDISFKSITKALDIERPSLFNLGNDLSFIVK